MAATTQPSSDHGASLEYIAYGKIVGAGGTLKRIGEALGRLKRGADIHQAEHAGFIAGLVDGIVLIIDRVFTDAAPDGWVDTIIFRLGRLALELDVLVNVVGERSTRGIDPDRELHASYETLRADQREVDALRRWLSNYVLYGMTP